MTEAVLEQRHAAVRADSTSRLVVAAVLWALLLGNAAAIVWLWVHGGNASDDLSAGELVTSLARLTGLLGAYAALVQVVLLARLPWLERLVGIDRVTVRHRWNGRVEQRVASQDLAAEGDLDDARRRHLTTGGFPDV